MSDCESELEEIEKSTRRVERSEDKYLESEERQKRCAKSLLWFFGDSNGNLSKIEDSSFTEILTTPYKKPVT